MAKKIIIENVELGNSGEISKDKINNNFGKIGKALDSLDGETIKTKNVTSTLGFSTTKVPNEYAISKETNRLQNEINKKPNREDVVISMINKGSVSTVANLPSNATKGDAYYVENEKFIYQYDGAKWNKTIFTAFPSNVAIKEDVINSISYTTITNGNTFSQSLIKDTKFYSYDVYCNLRAGDKIEVSISSDMPIKTLSLSTLDESHNVIVLDFARVGDNTDLKASYTLLQDCAYIRFYAGDPDISVVGASIQIELKLKKSIVPLFNLEKPKSLNVVRNRNSFILTFTEENKIIIYGRTFKEISIEAGTSFNIANQNALIINPSDELELIATYRIATKYGLNNILVLFENNYNVQIGLLSDFLTERRHYFSTASVVYNKDAVNYINTQSGGIKVRIKEGINLNARLSDGWEQIKYNSAIDLTCWDEHFIYWDIANNNIVESSVNVTSNLTGFVLLIRNEGGVITDGLFKSLEPDSSLLNAGVKYKRNLLMASNYSGFDLKLSLKRGECVELRMKTNAGSESAGSVLTFSLLDKDKNILLQDFVRKLNTDNAEILYINPIDNVEYIRLYTGYKNSSLEIQISAQKIISDYNKQTRDSDIALLTKKITETAGSQGITVVNNKIWHFHASSDDHNTTSTYVVFDAKTREFITRYKHNIGHVNSCDYNAVTDTFFACNENEKHIGFDLLFLPNASSHVGNIDITNMIKITFTESEKILDQYGGMACFGEQADIVYLISQQAKMIFKVQLGMGSNDFSDKTTEQTDVAHWGTFISGKTDNQYNGTAKVLNKYYSDKDLGLPQGLCYHNGALYMLVGYGIGADNIHKIKLYKEGTWNIVDSYDFQILEKSEANYKEGDNSLTIEPEGLTVYNGCYFLYGGITLLNGNSQTITTNLYISPLPESNKQCGFGKTGTKTMFDFANKDNLPRINITPIQPHSVYIESVERDGFVAKSDIDGVEFYWECGINI